MYVGYSLYLYTILRVLLTRSMVIGLMVIGLMFWSLNEVARPYHAVKDWALGLPRVLELLSTSGCKFPFPVAVFLQSVDELFEVMETWGFAISFANCQPGNTCRSEYIHVEGGATQPAAGAPPLLRHWPLVLKYFLY